MITIIVIIMFHWFLIFASNQNHSSLKFLLLASDNPCAFTARSITILMIMIMIKMSWKVFFANNLFVYKFINWILSQPSCSDFVSANFVQRHGSQGVLSRGALAETSLTANNEMSTFCPSNHPFYNLLQRSAQFWCNNFLWKKQETLQ